MGPRLAARGLGLAWLRWLAVRRLLARPGTAVATELVLATSVLYILFPSAAGLAIYRTQERVVQEGPGLRITARCAPAGGGPPFDRATLESLARLTGVKLAFPRVELGVVVATEPGGRGVMTLLECTVPGDGAVHPTRLAWGRTVRRGALSEAVVGPGLLRRLRVAEQDWPGRVFVRVERTVQGVPQVREVALAITGVLMPGQAGSLLVSLELAQELDEFCTPTARASPTPGSIGDPAPGWPRATIEVNGPEDLEPVVRALENRGYETRHGLAESQGLRRLGRLLTLGVATAALGTALNAALMVLLVSWLDVAGNERREIANYRLLGFAKCRVLCIYGLQALFLGSAALVLAGLAFHLALGLVPALPWPFEAPAAMIAQSGHGLALAWLAAAVVAIGLPLLGTSIPVLLSLRRPLAEALRNDR